MFRDAISAGQSHGDSDLERFKLGLGCGGCRQAKGGPQRSRSAASGLVVLSSTAALGHGWGMRRRAPCEQTMG